MTRTRADRFLVGGALIPSGSDTVPGATGPDEVSWASRQNEHELSPSSRAAAPCGIVPCHPSMAGRCLCAEASNPVTATTTATIAAKTANRGVRGISGDDVRMEIGTLDSPRRGVKRANHALTCGASESIDSGRNVQCGNSRLPRRCSSRRSSPWPDRSITTLSPRGPTITRGSARRRRSPWRSNRARFAGSRIRPSTSQQPPSRHSRPIPRRALSLPRPALPRLRAVRSFAIPAHLPSSDPSRPTLHTNVVPQRRLFGRRVGQS